jgi:hypothetical protein
MPSRHQLIKRKQFRLRWVKRKAKRTPWRRAEVKLMRFLGMNSLAWIKRKMAIEQRLKKKNEKLLSQPT